MRRATKEIVIVFVLIVIIIIRYFYFLPTPQNDFYEAIGKEVVFLGIVNEYPDKRENQIRLTVTPENFKFNILVPSYDIEKNFQYGDVLKISGILTLPENFETNTGKEFDYGKYLFANDTFFIIKNSKIEKIQEKGNKIKKGVFYIREKFENSLYDVLPIRDAGFINGLLLGSKGGINDEDKEAFVRTGTIHIVALSGFNVMIVAEAIMKIMSIIAYGTVAYASAGVVVILFVIMAGAGATAIRAGLMAVLALIARSTGRTYMALRALFIVSLVMLVINPRIIFDVSFHLSVLATFGVIAIPVRILKYFIWIPEWKGFRSMILATLSASIAVIPYIMYVMGSVSVVSLFANILILPIISYLMLFGFIAGIFGLFSSILAIPFSYIVHIGDAYLFSVVEFFSRFAFASFNIKKLPLIFVIVFYVWLLYWVFKKEKIIKN